MFSGMKVRIHRNKVIIVTIVFCIVLFLSQTMRDKDYSRFQKYIPNINYSAVIDPHQIVLSRGVFKKEEYRKTKTILLFTTHFYSDIWKGLHPDLLKEYTSNAKCCIQECSVTYDKKKISTADVVVFHGVDFGFRNFTSHHFHALSANRPSYQRWLFWMHETPVYYPESENYNNLFNWTMTFSRQSDIYHPYYSYTQLNSEDRPSKYNHATGKSKAVAWMVSRCGLIRSEYVMELQNYVDVTVYGLCGTSFNNMGGICSKTESECMQELTQYKFYLAFENSFCEDYVTEKYYKLGLMYGLVPIVMGANYDDMNAIPGSYIDVSKFSSIKELGDYLNYLDTHDDIYNLYFEWRNHFEVTNSIDKICLICQATHNEERKRQSYKDFNAFWSSRNLCDPYEKVKQKLNHQIQESKSNRQRNKAN